MELSIKSPKEDLIQITKETINKIQIIDKDKVPLSDYHILSSLNNYSNGQFDEHETHYNLSNIFIDEIIPPLIKMTVKKNSRNTLLKVAFISTFYTAFIGSPEFKMIGTLFSGFLFTASLGFHLDLKRLESYNNITAFDEKVDILYKPVEFFKQGLYDSKKDIRNVLDEYYYK